MSIRCVNWMNLENMKKAVSDYEKLYGAPDEKRVILNTDV